jgi:hypothetical protein
MSNCPISVETISAEGEVIAHRAFDFWEAALEYIRSLNTLPDRLRVFVPGSLATNAQENELRAALGLAPVWN